MDRSRGFGRVVHWLRDARAELRRIIWPTFKEARNLTLVVIVLSAVMGAILWVFDIGFAEIYLLVFRAIGQ